MIREILLDEGYSNIISAKNKREALQKFYEAKPDMLIFGYHAARRRRFFTSRRNTEKLRCSRSFSYLPKTPWMTKYYGFSLGADDYLTKTL